jgi:hypothetical protein
MVKNFGIKISLGIPHNFAEILVQNSAEYGRGIPEKIVRGIPKKY